MNTLQDFNIVVSTLSADKKFSHYGVLFDNGNISLSEPYKSEGYSTTNFKSEQEVSSAVFNILSNRESFLNSIPNFESASCVEIQVRSEVDWNFKVIYKIQLKRTLFL